MSPFWFSPFGSHHFGSRDTNTPTRPVTSGASKPSSLRPQISRDIARWLPDGRTRGTRRGDLELILTTGQVGDEGSYDSPPRTKRYTCRFPRDPSCTPKSDTLVPLYWYVCRSCDMQVIDTYNVSSNSTHCKTTENPTRSLCPDRAIGSRSRDESPIPTLTNTLSYQCPPHPYG